MTTKVACTKCGAQILVSTAERTGGVCMPCKKGWVRVLNEETVGHKFPHKTQENLTGFIVEVSPKNQAPIFYLYDRCTKVLQPDESFVGYFWQMTDKQKDGTFNKAHVQETILIDKNKKLFSYGCEAVFSTDEVLIVIRALRGPESSNRFLPEALKHKYETWNLLK